MRGALLAATLLCVAFGVALAFAPRRAWVACLALLAASSMAGAASGLAQAFTGPLLLFGWLSVVACASAVHWPEGVPAWVAIGLSIDAGLCAGALVALEGGWSDLPSALCGVLAVAPAAFAVRLRLAIAAKVASSWLIAIALLAAALPYLPVTPGYLPDHLE